MPEGGVEPPTRRFSIVCSTTELLRHIIAAVGIFEVPCKRMKRAYGEALRDWQDPNSVFACNIFGRGLLARHSIAITKPLGEVAVAASARAKGREFLRARLLANRARTFLESGAHRAIACAKPASSARVRFVSNWMSSIARPDASASSISQSSGIAARTAG